MALDIASGFTFSKRDEAEALHRQIEAMKLAFCDGKQYIADPCFMKTSVDEWLSPEYADRRRALIADEALLPEPIDVNCGGTVYLCSADGEGNMVSFIQSNYNGFGSGIVVPGYGISSATGDTTSPWIWPVITASGRERNRTIPSFPAS